MSGMMSDDEKAIRDLVATWIASTKTGDLATVLGLMSDDVVFMVPGKEPFGKEEFSAASAGMKGLQIEASSDIQEVTVLGDWAWMRNRLRTTITPQSGKPIVRSGYTLTILRKGHDGAWAVSRCKFTRAGNIA